MEQHITIKDIAAHTGVSPGTVDRVIHNRGNVSAKVSERIMAAMKELGYQPNIAARTLANRHKPLRVVALLPDYTKDLYWVQPKEGVERAVADAAHYGVVVRYCFFSQFDAEDFVKKSQDILSDEPDALLLAPIFLAESQHLLVEAGHRNICSVLINTQIEHKAALSYIGQDSYQSGVLAGRLLNFGLNDGDEALVLNLDFSVANAKHLMDKQRGFEDFFKGTSDKSIVIHQAAIDFFDDAPCLKDWADDFFSRHPRLSGVFVTNSRAYLLLNVLPPALQKRLKVVGFDLIQPNIDLLAENKIRFLINQNAWHQGYLGLLSIINHLVMSRNVPPLQYLPLDIVVKENVQYYLKRMLELPIAVV